MTTTALQDLLAVQDLDLALDQVRHRQAHLPERAELDRIDAETSAARAELEQVTSSRAELARHQATTEAELSATEERSAAVTARLYSGEVSASRDLQALAAELEHLKARSSALEDAVLEGLEGLEPLDARRAELEAAISRLGGQKSEVAERLAGAAESLDGEVADISARRDRAAGSVPADLMATYERLRARLGGIGVARLVGNHCDGCHLALSAAELDRVRHGADGEVATCEQCSRILVP